MNSTATASATFPKAPLYGKVGQSILHNVVQLRPTAGATPTTENGKVVPPRRVTNIERRTREHLTPDEIEKLMTAAGRIGRHGHWDATLVHGEFLFFHYRAAEAARFYLTRPKSFERPTNWFLTKCLVENISC